MNDIITNSNCVDKHLLASVAHPYANTVYVLTNIYIMCVLLYTNLLTLCLEYWYQDGLDEFFCRLCLLSYDPFVGDVITVPGTVAEGRPCDSCGTPNRTPGAGDIDIDDYSVRHNPDLGDDSMRPDIQEMQRRQAAENHCNDHDFHLDDSSQTYSCMPPNSMVRNEDMASSNQPDSKDSQLAPEFEPAYIPQFGLKSYRSSNVLIISTSLQESTTSATSVNLKARCEFGASSESSLTSLDIDILESNVCQKVVQRSHSPTNNNIACDTGDRRYICKTCNKSFSRQDHLVAHNRTHTGERPYSCTTCNKALQQCNLVKHIRTHTGERSFSCQTCDKSFSVQDHLVVHIRTHTGQRPYSCTTCNKAFSEQATLVRHIRTHTDERPYSCTDCNKEFCQLTDLTRHIRTHTGKRPYKCDQCEMAFIHASDRARHIRAKHPGQCVEENACNQVLSFSSLILLF